MNGDERLKALEDRFNRFEVRTEAELARGRTSFAKQEIFERAERELKSDLNDLSGDVKALREEMKSDREARDQSYKAVRNLVLAALASGLVSLGVALATRAP